MTEVKAKSFPWERPLKVTEILRRSLTYLKPQRLRLLTAFLLVLLNVGFDLALPLFISSATRNLQSDAVNLVFIIGLAVGYIAIGAVNQVVLYVLSMILQRAGQSVVAQLRLEVYHHVQSLSQSQLDGMPVGSLSPPRPTPWAAPMSTPARARSSGPT